MRASIISLMLLALTISCGADDSKSSNSSDEATSTTLESVMLTQMSKIDGTSDESAVSPEVEFKWTEDEIIYETAGCINQDFSSVKRKSFEEQIPSYCYCLASLMAIKHTYDEFLNDREKILDTFITNGTPFCMKFSEEYVANSKK